MNKDLLQQIYRQYQRELYLYLYGLCHNRAAAEDMMQETFLKAFLSLPDGHPNFRAWLYTVAHHLVLDGFRKEKHLAPLTENQAAEEGELAKRLIADETRSSLYRAMGQLDSLKREVLLLQYFPKLPQKEIAGILGIRADYVRVLAGRAKKELKKKMEEAGYEI